MSEQGEKALTDENVDGIQVMLEAQGFGPEDLKLVDKLCAQAKAYNALRTAPAPSEGKALEALEWFIGDAKRQGERLTREALQKKGLEAEDRLFLAALYGKHGAALASIQAALATPTPPEV